MNIFQSAVQKLTLWYVSALFVVCLAFSVPVYVISSNRLAHSAMKQTEIIRRFDTRFGTFVPDIVDLRDQQITRDRQQLLRTIIIANLLILALGAYFSYRFAKRTLRPIEEAHTAQARFATDASHELRTPLAVMQAEIEVALRGKKLTAGQAKDVLTSNLEEVARLRNLSEQLLNLTRLDNGQSQKSKVALSKLVAEEISHLEKTYHVKIRHTIHKDVSVTGDEHLLRQLINILVDNAVKYAGDKPTDIRLSLKNQHDKIQLTVTDHGIGIRASELQHVFERFYRGSDAARHSSAGHGLGLSLAKRIVDTHGGDIQVTSQPGKQTVFEITLPS